jgi:hypothetical protein
MERPTPPSCRTRQKVTRLEKWYVPPPSFRTQRDGNKTRAMSRPSPRHAEPERRLQNKRNGAAFPLSCGTRVKVIKQEKWRVLPLSCRTWETVRRLEKWRVPPPSCRTQRDGNKTREIASTSQSSSYRIREVTSQEKWRVSPPSSRTQGDSNKTGEMKHPTHIL